MVRTTASHRIASHHKCLISLPTYVAILKTTTKHSVHSPNSSPPLLSSLTHTESRTNTRPGARSANMKPVVSGKSRLHLQVHVLTARRFYHTDILSQTAFNAWTWYAHINADDEHPVDRSIELTRQTSAHSIVISIFGIVILSTIGSMFATNHHSMMGANDDPEDGKAVATAVFGAVVVYAVRLTPYIQNRQQRRDGLARQREKEIDKRRWTERTP